MTNKNSPKNVIDNYKRRQKMTPYVIGGMAALLVIAGVVIIFLALNGGRLVPAPTETPTVPAPTSTFTATATNSPVPATATLQPSATLTVTASATATATGPFEYTVLEKDNCWDIAIKFKVELTVLLALNNFAAGQCPIAPGQKIMIPAAGQTLPSATPVDVSKIAAGTLYEYIIQPGDTLRAIALRFNSTQNAIMLQNKITDPNKIEVGVKIIIPVNIATPVPTTTDTPTPKPGTPSVTPASTATLSPAATLTATKAP
jgi:LysM repeat protein